MPSRRILASSRAGGNDDPSVPVLPDPLTQEATNGWHLVSRVAAGYQGEESTQRLQLGITITYGPPPKECW